MKRSDALREIQSELAINLGAILLPLPAEVVCHKILERLESIGMAPPADKERSFELQEDGTLTYEFREWEPE